jgi:hypothetical protein
MRIEMGFTRKNNNSRAIIQPGVFLLEAILQRLGRSSDLYFDTFLSAQDFNEKQMRNEVTSLLVLLKYDEAAELLEVLEGKKSFQSGINLQFILNAKASIVSAREGYGQAYIELINKAISITIPDFDEMKITGYRLTYIEITLINKLANYAGENGDVPRALNIYKRLRDNMNYNYLDEHEKVRTYSMILYNYSKYLGLEGRYAEALTLIAEGELLALKHKRLSDMPGFMINKACDLLEIGNKEDSIPFFALSYYGSEIINDLKSQRIDADYVKEKLKIVFA